VPRRQSGSQFAAQVPKKTPKITGAGQQPFEGLSMGARSATQCVRFSDTPHSYASRLEEHLIEDLVKACGTEASS
jgi:hypothetical protein